MPYTFHDIEVYVCQIFLKYKLAKVANLLLQTKKPPTYVLVETVGIEPTSKGIATKASTRVVGILSFAIPSAYQQASRRLVRLVSATILRLRIEAKARYI
jgi:hypothetical protein